MWPSGSEYYKSTYENIRYWLYSHQGLMRKVDQVKFSQPVNTISISLQNHPVKVAWMLCNNNLFVQTLQSKYSSHLSFAQLNWQESFLRYGSRTTLISVKLQIWTIAGPMQSTSVGFSRTKPCSFLIYSMWANLICKPNALHEELSGGGNGIWQKLIWRPPPPPPPPPPNLIRCPPHQ